MRSVARHTKVEFTESSGGVHTNLIGSVSDGQGSTLAPAAGLAECSPTAWLEERHGANTCLCVLELDAGVSERF